MELIKETVIRGYGIVTKNKTDILAFHWHEPFELLHLINNPCNIMVDAELIKAKKGDIVVVPPKTAHRLIIEEDDTKVRIFQFPKDVLISGVEPMKTLKRHITSEEIEKADSLSETLDKIYDIMDEERKIDRMVNNPSLNFLSATVYYQLMRYFSVDEESKMVKDSEIFLEIIEYVNENFTKKINSEKVSAHFYMSRRKLNSIFPKYAGTSLSEYIAGLRIKKANKLLKDGVSVTETALNCGFSTIRTFNNTYKNYVGMTPTEYIKRNGELK